MKTGHSGRTPEPSGGQRAAFSAETKIDREDWGLSWNRALETGGWMVSEEIRTSIEVRAVLQEG